MLITEEQKKLLIGYRDKCDGKIPELKIKKNKV